MTLPPWVKVVELMALLGLSQARFELERCEG
jgi:hypothetical protein